MPGSLRIRRSGNRSRTFRRFFVLDDSRQAADFEGDGVGSPQSASDTFVWRGAEYRTRSAPPYELTPGAPHRLSMFTRSEAKNLEMAGSPCLEILRRFAPQDERNR